MNAPLCTDYRALRAAPLQSVRRSRVEEEASVGHVSVNLARIKRTVEVANFPEYRESDTPKQRGSVSIARITRRLLGYNSPLRYKYPLFKLFSSSPISRESCVSAQGIQHQVVQLATAQGNVVVERHRNRWIC